MERIVRPACIYIEGTGGRMTVRGHKGIAEYTQERLRLRVEGGMVVVNGSGLWLEEMDGEDIAVAGKIDCVELERRT